ncbi:MAG: hypothetical protein EB039_12395 [Proteobacteria bacterium]|nr:hypothetical protein [Pseudomonadota bacterium]
MVVKTGVTGPSGCERAPDDAVPSTASGLRSRRSVLGLPISAGIIAGLVSGCQVPSMPPLPKAVRAIVESGLPPENQDVFHAFLRGSDAMPILEGPEAQWAVVADPPARVEATPDLLRLISVPGHPVWASPRLP